MNPARDLTPAAVLLAVAVAAPAVAQQAGAGRAAHTMPAAPSVTPSSAQGAAAAAPSAVATEERHDMAPLYFGAVLLDQNEVRTNFRGGNLYAWQGLAYYGTDYHRAWINFQGETIAGGGGVERAEIQALYSRLLSYYWDIQGAERHDVNIDPQDGTPGRTYGMISLQGLAPGFFQVQLQAFVSQTGIFLARAAASYDLLITNRLVLQPEFELNFSSGWDRQALIAPGLYRSEAGLRLRYEITREFAPYIGYSFDSFNGGATGLNRRLGPVSSRSTFVAGIRLFF